MRVIAFEEAMRSQPAALAHLESRLRGELREFPAGVARWRKGDTVALLGMGAAHHSTHALAQVLRQTGFRVLNTPASEIEGAEPAALGDHVVVVTESGRSPEPIEAARRFPAGHRLVITNDPNAPVRQVADAVVGLGGFADSRAYTVGFTAMLLAYDRLAAALALNADERGGVTEAVVTALDEFASPAGGLATSIAHASAIDVVGSGASFAAAAEIALLARECLRIPSAAFETKQYLHGPMESVGPGTTVIVIGDGREREIPESLQSSGAGFVVIGSRSAGREPHFDVGDTHGFARVAAEVVAGQHLMAAAIGLLPFTIEEFVHGQPDTKL